MIRYISACLPKRLLHFIMNNRAAIARSIELTTVPLRDQQPTEAPNQKQRPISISSKFKHKERHIYSNSALQNVSMIARISIVLRL